MRPLRVELQGFTAFKEHTVVDFGDAGYFALVGPTGSGKSTVIDAICFALYGSVPRYDDERLVAPVITQGSLEARVRLDFAVGDVTYTAVRVVRRGRGAAATTKEARLECNGEVIAGNADELGAEVAKLVGLSFKQFTKCVVLPQGDFARFLHDRPSDRQDLLVKLLNLGVYERMRREAAGRAADAGAKIEIVEHRLDTDFGFATLDHLDEATAHLERVVALYDRVASESPRLHELERAATAAKSDADEARTWAGMLETVEMPPGTKELGDELAKARAALLRSEDLAREAEAGLARAIEARSAMPPERTPLELALAAHDEIASVTKRIATAEKEVKAVRVGADAAAGRLGEAEKQLEEAREAERAAGERHQAIHLARSLVVGQPCPVCLQPVAAMPEHDVPADLGEAAAEIAAARSAYTSAIDEWRALDGRVNHLAAGLDSLVTRRRELEAGLGDHHDRETLVQILESIAAADEESNKRRAAADLERSRLDETRAALARIKEREEEGRREYDDLRDRLAHLKPPAAHRKTLSEDWTSLVAWASKKAPVERARAKSLETAADRAALERDALMEALERSCRDCGIAIGTSDVMEAVLVARENARGAVERIEKGMAAVAELEEQLKLHKRVHALAHSLALHLSAKGFEKWLVNEALVRLVGGATQILNELSEGQYSLAIDAGGNFLVTDHHNADEKRSARTLSGGETFLASLALALALSDQLADLASAGAARLDAIFLDEGFGTLDPQTLDSVAATIENLAATGRVVGVVTHVRELAERIPVQFRVRKSPATSTIERVDA